MPFSFCMMDIVEEDAPESKQTNGPCGSASAVGSAGAYPSEDAGGRAR